MSTHTHFEQCGDAVNSDLRASLGWDEKQEQKVERMQKIERK